MNRPSDQHLHPLYLLNRNYATVSHKLSGSQQVECQDVNIQKLFGEMTNYLEELGYGA